MAQRIIVFGIVLAAVVVGCIATPLPTPPTADTERMSLTESTSGETTLAGEAGAINLDEAGVLGLRVTAAAAWTQVPLAADGSFTASLPATLAETFYLEVVFADRDLFLIAVTGFFGGGGGAMEADPGADRDGDGSPDAVDCDPDDPTLTGHRCPEECVPAAEICNGVDDDCDGTVDEGCASGDDVDGDGFAEPADCDDGNPTINPGALEVCNGLDDDCDGEVDDDCSGACSTDADCLGGVCEAGVCVCGAGLSLCAFECVDTDTNTDHCGACGNPCSAGQTCVGGTCTG